MPENNSEANSQPVSEEAEARRELEAEGHQFDDQGRVEEENQSSDESAPEESSEAESEEGNDPDPEEKSDESNVKSDEEAEEDTDKEEKPERSNRSPKFIPAWKLEVTKKKFAERESKLLGELESFKKVSTPQEKGDASNEDVKDQIEKIGQEYGTDPKFIEEILGLVDKGKSIPSDLVDRLQKLEIEKQEAQEENEFASEFDRDVAPLVKESYPEISDSALQKVKSAIHDMAFTEEYHKLPLAKILKAEKESIDKLIPALKKKTMDDGKSGKVRSAAKQKSDVTEDDLENMSDEDLLALEQEKRGNTWKR